MPLTESAKCSLHVLFRVALEKHMPSHQSPYSVSPQALLLKPLKKLATIRVEFLHALETQTGREFSTYLFIPQSSTVVG